MKASESLPNFRSVLRMYANFSARTIKKICAEIGPREAGSAAELEAENFIAKQIGDSADEVKQEEFRISHRAFLGWLRVAAVFMLIASAVNILNIFAGENIKYGPVITLILCAATAVMLFGEFLFYKPVIDPFFPKLTSHNTYCIRKASGETKRRIILCGHTDSSIEWRYTHMGGAPLMYFSFIYPAAGLIYTLAVSVYMLFSGIRPVLIWIGCIFIPAYIILFMFMNYKICVDGANDNLTGCMTGAAVLKFMGDNNIRFENTEVIAMLSGSEEEGLRGAKAAARLHPEFKDGDIETAVLAFDTIKDYDDMAVYSKDMSGLTKHDERVCELLKQAGRNAGVELPYSEIFAGASDAAAMTQAGIPSACFAAMNPGPPKYYHTRDDKADILNLKAIEKGVEIALEAVYLFDEQGLKKQYS